MQSIEICGLDLVERKGEETGISEGVFWPRQPEPPLENQVVVIVGGHTSHVMETHDVQDVIRVGEVDVTIFVLDNEPKFLEEFRLDSKAIRELRGHGLVSAFGGVCDRNALDLPGGRRNCRMHGAITERFRTELEVFLKEEMLSAHERRKGGSCAPT